MKGFTLIEILVVVFILLILAGAALVAFRSYQQNQLLTGNASQVISSLRLAQSKTISSVDSSAYGIHFDVSQCVLFIGPAYNPSDSDNQIFPISFGAEIYNINLIGSGSEVLFDRLNGRTQEPGNISLRIIADHSKTKTVYITSSGQMSLTAPLVSITGRITDSRHMHFDYSRAINTASENITLTFSDPPNSNVSQDILIADNLDANNQIYWQGTVNVNGSNQTVEIGTHQLNNPNTAFSVNRDRRYNNKALSIFLSGDPTHSLISYTANGTTTPGTSVYVSNFQAQ